MNRYAVPPDQGPIPLEDGRVDVGEVLRLLERRAMYWKKAAEHRAAHEAWSIACILCEVTGYPMPSTWCGKAQ